MTIMMDDQDHLKLMKVPEIRKPSRSCFISASSILNKTNKLNQILNSENEIVYALVEVSNELNKSSKTWKIPLNHKDFQNIRRKLMNPQICKSGRKVLNPSKRKQVAESNRMTINISNDEKYQQNNILASQKLLSQDEIRLNHKWSNHSSIDNGKINKKDGIHRNLFSPDHRTSEAESHQVKVLFNRSNLRSHDKKIEEESIRLISRGTSTEILYTPELIEKALQRLIFNFKEDRSNCNLKDKKNFGSNAFNQRETFSTTVSPTTGKLNFVPFIITNNQVSDYHRFHSLIFTEPKNDTVKTNEFRSDGLPISKDDPNEKCLTDNRTDQMVKRNRNMEEKEKIENKRNQLNIGDEVCLLKEVKMMQKRINSIVELLKSNNFVCSHNVVNNKNVNDLLLNETVYTRESYGNRKQYDIKEYLNEKSSKNNLQYLDCGVQVMVIKSCTDKIVMVPSRTIVKSFINRFVQAPNEDIIKCLIRPKRLMLCKSVPLLKNKIEGHYARIKRVSSEQSSNKPIEDSEHLNKKNINLECEGSKPKNSVPGSKLKLIKKIFNPHGAEKKTNIIYRKDRMMLLSEKEREKSFEQPKMENIKITGNTILFTENRSSGIGTIKMELNELGSIKISNKISRKTKSTDSISCSEYTVNNSPDCSSKIIYNNAISGIKLEEDYTKLTGKQTFSKIPAREIPQKKVNATKPTNNKSKSFAKNTNSSQSIPKISKVEKSSMPVRMVFKTKESRLDSTKLRKLQTQKNQTIVTNADENHLVKSPWSVRNGEKMNKKRNIASFTPKSPHSKPVLNSQNDKNPNGVFPESKIEKSCEISGNSNVEVSGAEKTPIVKSIWALTKIVLYEDGGHTFEILETSSNPLQCQSK